MVKGVGPKKPKNKAEREEREAGSELWASLLKEQFLIEYTFDGKLFLLKVEGQTPFKCAFCSEGNFVFLSGYVVPQSQYGLWCRSCNNATKIQHEYFWPYIQEAYEKELPKEELNNAEINQGTSTPD